MSRVGGSPERGGLELVFDGLEALVPAAFCVGRGVVKQGGMNPSGRLDKVVRTSHYLVFGQASMHLEDDQLVPVFVFLTRNGKEKRSVGQRVRPRFKQRQGGHVLPGLERVEVRDPRLVEVETKAEAVLTHDVDRSDSVGPRSPPAPMLAIPPIGKHRSGVVPTVNAPPRGRQAVRKGARVAGTVDQSVRIPWRMVFGLPDGIRRRCHASRRDRRPSNMTERA